MAANELIKYNSLQLQKISNSLSITTKLLELNQRQKIMDFFIEYPHFFDLFVPLFYPLNEELIVKYNKYWLWCGLSANENILWTNALIEKFESEWCWVCLTTNESIPWTNELIKKYQDKWKLDGYGTLVDNKKIIWTEDIIDMYHEQLDWERFSNNENIVWADELLEKYKHKWDWERLSSNENIVWTNELIEIHKDKWHWDKLSKNKALPWTEELIDNYKDRWNWGYYGGGLRTNEKIPWTKDLILKYKDIFKHFDISVDEFIEEVSQTYFLENGKKSFEVVMSHYKYEALHGVHWPNITLDKNILWNEEQIEKYKQHLHWYNFCETVEWTEQILEKFKDRWNWKLLSSNAKLPWSEMLIEKYQDKWDWEGLSRNQSIILTEDLISKYGNRFPSWCSLLRNKSFPWSISFVSRNKAKFNFNWAEMKCIEFWQKGFQPYVDDKMIKELMEMKKK